MRDFKDLKVWEKSHKFVLSIYEVTRGFPDEERFGLIGQIRRAAAAIATNIAEGCGRSGERELARFVSIASGSASESEYHLLLARDLGYIGAERYQELDCLVNEIKKMLTSLMQKLMANS